MAGFNYAQNIIGLNKTNGDIHELEVEVANLSASVLEIKGDIEDIDLSISQLSASTLPYSSEDTIKEKIDDVAGDIPTNTNQLTNGAGFITALGLQAGTIGSGEKIITKLVSNDLPIGASMWLCQQADDSPDVGNVGAVLIIKATGGGLYSRLYAFVGGSIYSAQTGNTIPTSLTWSKISTT